VYYALSLEDVDEAAKIIRPTMPVAREHLAGFLQLGPLVVAAKIAAASGSEQTAARLLGAVHDNWWSFVPGQRQQYERLVSRLTALLGAAAFDEELRVGAELSVDQALQLAEVVVASRAVK
jgi:hypothetical protein